MNDNISMSKILWEKGKINEKEMETNNQRGKMHDTANSRKKCLD